MALAANDIVITFASTSLPHSALPLRGSVESTGPTLVNWEDGSTATYTVDGQLRKLIPLNDPANNIVTSRVRLGVGAPNKGQRAEGVVVAAFGLETPAGANLNDFVTIQFDDGSFGTVGVGAVEVIG